jgi:N-methylhydantoinase A/oxoprolinase/acetone carboxylase beta subunit
MSWRVGVDSGGTFTDTCLFDNATGRCRRDAPRRMAGHDEGTQRPT